MGLDEAVTKPRQLVRRDEWNHPALDQIDIILGMRPELDRDFMRSQKSGNQFQGGDLCQLSNDFQHLRFVFKIESVAALGFDRGRSMLQKLTHSPESCLQQFFLGAVPHGTNAAQDSSTPFSDLLVRGSLDSQLVL